MLVKETLFGRIKFLLAHPAVIYLLLMSWICLPLISFLKSVEIAEIPPHTGNFLNSILWPCDAIWWHISGITLAQVMACCLTAPSDCLNQCWLISVGSYGIHLRPISQVVLKISVSNKSLINDKYPNEITATSARGQWVKNLLIISMMVIDMATQGANKVMQSLVNFTQVMTLVRVSTVQIH